MYCYITTYSFAPNETYGFGPFPTYDAAWNTMLADANVEKEKHETATIDKDVGKITLRANNGDITVWTIVKITEPDPFLKNIEQQSVTSDDSAGATFVKPKPDADTIKLVNTEKLDCAILWSGVADIEYLINSGAYDDQLKAFSTPTIRGIINDAAARIDWNHVQDACIEAGNNLLATALEDAIHDAVQTVTDTKKTGIETDDLIKMLQRDAAVENTVEIFSNNGHTIETYDFEQDRNITYRLDKPTAEWLREITLVTKQAQTLVSKNTVNALLDMFVDIDSNMFTNLRHILFVTEHDDDLDEITAFMDVEACEVCSYFDYLGMFWYAESTIVINVECIAAAVKELTAECEPLYGDASRTFAAQEFIIGLYTTMIHELRHLALKNPYLDEEEYPCELASEENVESWARAQTDKVLGRINQIAGVMLSQKENDNETE